MKILAKNIWDNLPLPDYRARFFVELFLELLSRDTPHFYQARLMNVISSAQELFESIDLYNINAKYLSVVHNSVHELRSSIESDPVAKVFFKREVATLDPLLKELEKENPAKNFLDKAQACLKAISRNREEYYKHIVIELRKSLVGETDLSKADRNLKSLHSIISIYVSNLLYLGYSPTYLFNRMELFTRINNYNGRSFQEQFNYVVSKLDGRERTYTVYFALKTNKKETLLKNEHLHSINFVEVIPIDLKNESENIFRGDKNLFIVVEIKSLDYISASWKAKEVVDKALDYIHTKVNKLNIDLLRNSLSVFKVGGNTYKQSINIDLLVRFLSHDHNISIHKTTSEKKVNKILSQAAFEQLGRSLRYLRIARESVSIEQKLLNAWIALESLFIDLSGKNLISKIVNFVPSAYAYDTFLERSRYILKLLSANKVSMPEDFKVAMNVSCDVFENTLDAEEFHNCLLNAALGKSLFFSLDEKEHLKYRLKLVVDEISSQKAIKERLKKTIEDVERQLKRLYLYRNKIAHLGHVSGIRPQLVNHLVDYLMVCYKAVFASIADGEENNLMSIADAIISYGLGIDEKDQYLALQNVSIEYSAWIIEPII